MKIGRRRPRCSKLIATGHGFCQSKAQLVRRPRCASALSGAAVDCRWGVDSARRERAARGQIFFLAACRRPHDGHQILLIARLISRDAFGLGRHWHTPAGTGARTAFPPPGDSSVVAPAALCLAGGAAKPTRRRRARRDPYLAAGLVEARLHPRPPSAPAHARGWWWLAPTVGFQKPKDMLGQCGTMSDARGSSSGRRRRPLSNVSATGTLRRLVPVCDRCFAGAMPPPYLPTSHGI